MAVSFSITYMFARFLHSLDVVETYDTSLVKDLNTTKYYLIRCITYFLLLKIFIYLFQMIIWNDSKCFCLFFINFRLIVVMFVVHISLRHPGELFWFLPRNPFIPLCNIVYGKRNKLLKSSTSPEDTNLPCTQRNYVTSRYILTKIDWPKLYWLWAHKSITVCFHL